MAVKSETKYKMEKIREEKGDVKRRGRESPRRRSSSREGAGNRQDLPRPDARQHAKPGRIRIDIRLTHLLGLWI